MTVISFSQSCFALSRETVFFCYFDCCPLESILRPTLAPILLDFTDYISDSLIGNNSAWRQNTKKTWIPETFGLPAATSFVYIWCPVNISESKKCHQAPVCGHNVALSRCAEMKWWVWWRNSSCSHMLDVYYCRKVNLSLPNPLIQLLFSNLQSMLSFPWHCFFFSSCVTT